MQKNKIVILGSNGMLGNGLLYELSKYDFEVIGLTRKDLDARDAYALQNMFIFNRPDIVINCIGIIKQVKEDIGITSYVNAVFPHKLMIQCNRFKAKLIHFSTDCIFDGKKGNYSETDQPNADDLYGITKFIGEVDYGNSFTMRTSIIGHGNNLSLIDWFLSQRKVKGYANVMYSGLPTVEIGKIIAKHIIPNDLRGLYNISADPISKYKLLKLVNRIYKADIKIDQDTNEVLDRTLDSTKFRKLVGYTPPSWEHLIGRMYQYFLDFGKSKE